MNSLLRDCYRSVVAIRDAVRKNVDDLVAGLGRTDITARRGATGVESHIKLLLAMNGVDFAELLETSYSCMSTHDVTTKLENFTTLDILSINTADKRLEAIEAIVTRIKGRYSTIEKLERHLRDDVRTSPNPISADRETKYVDWDNAIFQTPDDSHSQCQQRAKSPDLVDVEILPSINAPVLQPSSKSSSTTTSTTISIHSLVDDAEPELAVVPKAKARLIAPVLQIWDSDEERLRAMQEHHYFTNRGDNPLVFRYGVQYTPSSISLIEWWDDRSRMVVFSGLRKGTTCRELLKHVRGGQILRVARADSTTTLVSFVNGGEAHAYVRYINNPFRPPLRILGALPCVGLVPTPSYPLRRSLMLDITRGRGATRCLGFPCFIDGLEAKVTAFFVRTGVWGWTDGQHTGLQNITVNSGGSDENRYSSAASELAEEWLVLDDNSANTSSNNTERARGNTPRRLLFKVSFRDITFAQNAYDLVRGQFPRCGVYYAPDPCAEPLSELDTYLSD
ncbi:hypothetical protein GGR51DRAFT_573412 [Nemania sp. FL0031]|nr:hypothetical protein GGR51DRAFT_573412 [Nemania sp. FL0031]